MGDKKQIHIETDEKMEGDVSNAAKEDAEASADTETAEAEGAVDIKASETADDLEKARTEAKENYDRLLRVSAEFENFKKRSNREISEFKKYANETLIKDLLNVIDNLERAIESAKDGASEGGSLVEGVDMILKEVFKIIENYGVAPIESLGKTFDPSFHQAMMQEEVADKPNNIVLKELQRGYMIHDRLLRPAMVVVSKAQNEANEKN